MKILKWLIEKTILNRKKPFYSKNLFIFCSKYVDIWYGDNNFNRETNGEYRVLKKIAPNSKVIFDVGANIGDYSKDILNINPNVEIHAFEPFSDSFDLLKRLPLVANNCAVGEKKDKKILYQMDRSTHNSFYPEKKEGKAIEVSVITLDDYCRDNNIKHIDFLKIDVEGHEFFVLKGARNLLKEKNIDYIQFEFSGATAESKSFLKDFIDIFEENGYELFRIRATDIKKVKYSPDRERFTLTNYIAIKNGLEVKI